MRPLVPRPVFVPEPATPWNTSLADPEADRRRLRLAVVAALLLHGLLFLASWPREAPQGAEAPAQKSLFVVRRYVYRPPEPPPPERVVERKRTARTIPVPERLLEEEPIREVERQLPIPEVDLPDLDWVEIPETPEPVEEVPDGPIPVGGKVRAPVKIHAPEPRYPELARRNRVEGQVLLQAVIDREGRVKRVRVLQPQPMGLSEAAVAAVEQWRFEPATLQGKPVEVYLSLMITFSLS
jgi:protein TonB